MMEWISVDTPPEKFGNYLVFQFGCLNKGYYTKKRGWEEEDGYPANDTVTHWMPLPEPPK